MSQDFDPELTGFDEPYIEPSGFADTGDTISASRNDSDAGDTRRANVQAIDDFDILPGIGPIDDGKPDATGSNANSSNGNATGRVGRPPGSKNRTKEKEANGTSINLEDMLVSLHLMGSTLLAAPTLAINKTQANEYAAALRDVMKFSSFNLDPKHVAYFRLACVMGGIYIPPVVDMFKQESKPDNPKVVPINDAKSQPKPAPQTAAPQPKVFDGMNLSKMSPSEFYYQPAGDSDFGS